MYFFNEAREIWTRRDERNDRTGGGGGEKTARGVDEDVNGVALKG